MLLYPEQWKSLFLIAFLGLLQEPLTRSSPWLRQVRYLRASYLHRLHCFSNFRTSTASLYEPGSRMFRDAAATVPSLALSIVCFISS